MKNSTSSSEERRSLKVTIIWNQHRRDHLVISGNDQFFASFVNMEQEVLERFPELGKYGRRKYFYTDEHGDEITLVTAKDLQNYLASWAGQYGRIFVRVKPELSRSWLAFGVSWFFLIWKCIGVVFTLMAIFAFILTTIHNYGK